MCKNETIKKIFLTILGVLYIFTFLSFFGNLFCLIAKIISIMKSSELISICLTISDLNLSIYFLILSIFDIKYSGNYYEYDEIWRKSITCTSLGVLANFSCILSNFSLLMMTFDKFFAIIFTFKYKKLSYFTSIIVSTSLITISFFLSILPVFFFEVKKKIQRKFFFMLF